MCVMMRNVLKGTKEHKRTPVPDYIYNILLDGKTTEPKDTKSTTNCARPFTISFKLAVF